MSDAAAHEVEAMRVHPTTSRKPHNSNALSVRVDTLNVQRLFRLPLQGEKVGLIPAPHGIEAITNTDRRCACLRFETAFPHGAPSWQDIVTKTIERMGNARLENRQAYIAEFNSMTQAQHQALRDMYEWTDPNEPAVGYHWLVEYLYAFQTDFPKPEVQALALVWGLPITVK